MLRVQSPAMNGSTKKVGAGLLVLLSALLIVAGVMYATTPASELSGLPGKSDYYEKLHAKQVKRVQQNGMTIKDGKVYQDDKLATSCPFLNKDKSCKLAEDRKLTKRGIGLIVLGLLALVGAWYSSGIRKPDGSMSGGEARTPAG